MWEGWSASGVWAFGRVTSCVMCERQNRYGSSLKSAIFGFIADTHKQKPTHIHTNIHRKHSSVQSPSGEICSRCLFCLTHEAIYSQTDT